MTSQLQLDLFGEPPPLPEPEEEREPISDDLPPLTAISDDQTALFCAEEIPIPEGAAEAAEIFATIYVHFESREDVQMFAAVIGQPVTTETRVICFPAGPIPSSMRYA